MKTSLNINLMTIIALRTRHVVLKHKPIIFISRRTIHLKEILEETSNANKLVPTSSFTLKNSKFPLTVSSIPVDYARHLFPKRTLWSHTFGEFICMIEVIVCQFKKILFSPSVPSSESYDFIFFHFPVKTYPGKPKSKAEVSVGVTNDFKFAGIPYSYDELSKKFTCSVCSVSVTHRTSMVTHIGRFHTGTLKT